MSDKEPVDDLLGREYGYPTITGIVLRREGDDAVVAVEVDGEWQEVIRELAENNFDHFWNPASLNAPVKSISQT
jgi:hypothetical protein